MCAGQLAEATDAGVGGTVPLPAALLPSAAASSGHPPALLLSTGERPHRQRAAKSPAERAYLSRTFAGPEMGAYITA